MNGWKPQRLPLSNTLDAPHGRDVHVWLIDLSIAEADAATLDAGERSRASRFVRLGDRQRYVAAHAGLRAILAAYIGVEPAQLQFSAAVRGKPRLVRGELRFNLSHSADHALLSVCRGAELGVDIEAWRGVDAELARAFLSADELASMCAAAQADDATLIACWTRKEAYLKALGCGLEIDPRSVRTGACAHPVDVDGIELRSLPAPSGYSASLAVVGGCTALELYRFEGTLQ